MTHAPLSPEVSARPTLRMQRTFNAPRELVWLAWSKPEHLVQWMGPVEWPAVIATCDFRVGGAWRVCLRSPETGADLWQGGVYTRIEEPRLLAFTFKWDDSHEDGPPVQTQVTVELTAAGDRTIMDFTQEGLKSDQSLTGHRHGWASTADRLAAWLADNPD